MRAASGTTSDVLEGLTEIHASIIPAVAKRKVVTSAGPARSRRLDSACEGLRDKHYTQVQRFWDVDSRARNNVRTSAWVDPQNAQSNTHIQLQASAGKQDVMAYCTDHDGSSASGAGEES